MSFDKPTRNLLAGTVARCRDRLSDDIINQLQSTYGLHPDGTTLDVARTEDQRRAAEDLRALLSHFQSTEAGSARARQAAAYGRLVREIGFTTLNRLAALRLCEERGLVVECVRRGMASDGFQLYDRIAGGALGDRYQTYRAFLESLFDELALDLGALFDRGAPQSLIFPGEAALSDVLELLTDPQLDARDVWRQDETIGWIYQYYNDPDERQAMRKASQAPRNSRELAVRNQFFTPRYVVEFLTDNTWAAPGTKCARATRVYPKPAATWCAAPTKSFSPQANPQSPIPNTQPPPPRPPRPENPRPGLRFRPLFALRL